jgi:hypothetical protein
MDTSRMRAMKLAAFLCALIVTCAHGAEAPPTFSPERLREDLASLEATLARIHPDLAHSVDRATLTRAIAGVDAQLTRPMTRDEAWAEFSALNPVLADGHLVVTYPGGVGAELARHLQSGGRLFPFNVHLDDDGELYVRSKLDGSASPLAGQHIDRIDGMTGHEVAARLLAHMNGDTPRFRAAMVSRRFPFFYWKLFGEQREFHLRITNVDAVVAGASAMPGGYAEATFEQTFGFELLEGDAALLTVREFYWSDKARFYAFTRDAFARMREAGTQTLIIDIRDNSGGDDDMWIDGLMPYIASKPYRNGSTYVLKIIEGRQAPGQRIGDVVRGSQETVYQPQPDNPLRYTGKVYVLIGPATYSSAVLFATAVQDHGFATVAGSGSAARSTQSGGIQSTKLPHTGIGFVVPRFILTRASGRAGLLTPDVLVPDDPFLRRSAIERLLTLAKRERDENHAFRKRR